MITNLFHRIRFAILKKRIKNNPYIGKEDIDGTCLYKEDGYSIRYRIIKLPEGQVGIEWIYQKRRLSAYEERMRKIRKGFFEFWYYQKWSFFLRPSFLFILIIGTLLFYSEVMETQETKMKRLKWMVAGMIGIDSKDVQYIGDGWLEISGQRKRAVDKKIEPIKYTFNPLGWIFFSEGGFLSRWRGEPYGYAKHSVVFNDRGDVWIKKKDTVWQHGRIDGETIKWDTPLPTMTRSGKIETVTRHEISIEDKKLKVIDQKLKN